MDELLKKIRNRTITREELLKLKEMLEKRIKEFEERGECEKAEAEAVILAMVENMLKKSIS